MEEQLRILKMLEEGKITAEQASEFLTALTPQKETEAAVSYTHLDVYKRQLRTRRQVQGQYPSTLPPPMYLMTAHMRRHVLICQMQAIFTAG